MRSGSGFCLIAGVFTYWLEFRCGAIIAEALTGSFVLLLTEVSCALFGTVLASCSSVA